MSTAKPAATGTSGPPPSAGASSVAPPPFPSYPGIPRGPGPYPTHENTSQQSQQQVSSNTDSTPTSAPAISHRSPGMKPQPPPPSTFPVQPPPVVPPAGVVTQRRGSGSGMKSKSSAMPINPTKNTKPSACPTAPMPPQSRPVPESESGTRAYNAPAVITHSGKSKSPEPWNDRSSNGIPPPPAAPGQKSNSPAAPPMKFPSLCPSAFVPKAQSTVDSATYAAANLRQMYAPEITAAAGTHSRNPTPEPRSPNQPSGPPGVQAPASRNGHPGPEVTQHRKSLSEPLSIQPQAIQSQATQSQATQPQANLPQANVPQANLPQANLSQAAQLQANQPQATQPHTIQPQANHPYITAPEPQVAPHRSITPEAHVSQLHNIPPEPRDVQVPPPSTFASTPASLDARPPAWTTSSPTGSQVDIKEGTVHSYELDMPLGMRLISSRQTLLMMEPLCLHSGSQFDVYKCWLLDEASRKGEIFTAKRFRNWAAIKDYYMKWQLCAHWMRAFNEGAKMRCRLLQSNQILELGDDLYLLQEYLLGPWCHSSELIDAFSHFSFCRSGCNYVLLDLQGMDTEFGDVKMASQRPTPYRIQCNGSADVEAFFHRHLCGDICQSLDLPSFFEKPLPAPVELEDFSALNGLSSYDQWAWLEDDGRSYNYNPEMQAAIRLAEKEQKPFVRIMVGSVTFGAIDVNRRQVLSLENGKAKYLHKRTVKPPSTPAPLKSTFLQVQLDSGWHTYDDFVQNAMWDVVQKGMTKMQVKMNDREYEFDFDKLEQLNVEQGTRRKLRFVEIVRRTVSADLVE